MKIINGLREEDFMNFRWNADVHTVRRRTGEYRILNNRGIYLGKIMENMDGSYRIMLDEETNETNDIEEVAKQIIKKELGEPKVVDLLTYRAQRSRIISLNYSKRVTRDYPKITNYLAA